MFKDLMSNILLVDIMSNREIMLTIAARFKRLRLDHFNMSRASLAEKSGVSENTIRNFEAKGQITLENLVALAATLKALKELLQLFPVPEVESIAELEARAKQRQRGTR